MRPHGVTAAILVLLAATTPAAGTADPYGDGRSSLSEFATLARDQGYDVQTILTTPLMLDGAEDDTLLVVVAPHRGYSASELEFIRSFVEDGGRLLVADDMGPGGDVGAEFGVQYDRIRVYGSNGSQSNEEGTEIVQASAELGASSFNLTLDLPTSLAKVGSSNRNLTEIGRTDEASFADLDDDKRISVTDLSGEMSVIYGVRDAEEDLAAVFLGDSGLLLDGFLDRAENRPFARSLLGELLGGEGRVVFDLSRHAGAGERAAATPVTAVVVGTTADPYWLVVSLVTAVIIGLVAWRLRSADAWTAHTFDPDRVIPRETPPSIGPEDIRSILLDALDPELRALVQNDAVDADRLERHLGDGEIAGFLAGEVAPEEPERLARILERFDALEATAEVTR